MRRFLFEIPALGITVHSFGAMFVLACVSAFSIAVWRARRERIDPNRVFELAVWLMGGGFVGARLLFIVQHPDSIQDAGDLVTFSQGGIVFYGCIIGGLIGSTIYWLRRPFPFLAMADAVAPALALGAGVGRIGCWLNGCCYGATCSPTWGVAFPAGSFAWLHQVAHGELPLAAPHSLPVHPTQLYSALDGFLILGLLTLYYPRRRRDGEVMALLMVTYPVTRFLIDALRDDEGPFFAGLTLSQNISVVLYCAGVFLWVRLLRRPAGRYADGSACPEETGSRRWHGPASIAGGLRPSEGQNKRPHEPAPAANRAS